jgi:hypothetical protein
MTHEVADLTFEPAGDPRSFQLALEICLDGGRCAHAHYRSLTEHLC